MYICNQLNCKGTHEPQMTFSDKGVVENDEPCHAGAVSMVVLSCV